MADLARAVGIEKPTLYHYFKGKGEILFWIHEEFIDLLVEKADARAATNPSAAEELLGAVGDIVALMETHRGHVRVFFEHHRELTTAQKETIRKKRDAYEDVVRRIVERGVADGEFRQLDTQLSTLAIFGMCNWTYQWYRADGAYTTDEIAYQFYDLILNGLAQD